MQQVTVTLERSDGRVTNIRIDLDDDAYRLLQDIAAKRKKRIEEVVIEALRVEQLLADRELLIRDRGMLKELVAV